jgi:SulP family sulfate permease
VRAGIVTRLLSSPVLTGDLAGAALVIIGSQLPKVFGISLEGTTRFAIVELLQRFDEWNWTAFAIGIGAAACMALVQRFAARLPAALIAIVLATLAVVILNLDKEADVDTVGKVRAGLPSVTSFSEVTGDDVLDLLAPAASIALLVYASSVVTARTLEAREGRDIAANREFVGLAAANVGAGVLSGFPANASDSRSFVLAGAGARSQMSNVICAGLVAITLFLLTPAVAEIPTAALGGVVLVTAIKLIDVGELRRLWGIRRSDFVLALTTFAGVVIVGVLEGILIGVGVSLAETMRRAIAPHRAVLGYLPGELPTYRDITNYADAETVPGLIVYRFDAPIFFANADAFRDEILLLVREAETPVREFVVSAEAIYDIDTTGITMLGRLLDDLDEAGVRLTFARVRTNVRRLMARTGLEERIGADNFYLTVVEAGRAYASRHRGPGIAEEEP